MDVFSDAEAKLLIISARRGILSGVGLAFTRCFPVGTSRLLSFHHVTRSLTSCCQLEPSVCEIPSGSSYKVEKVLRVIVCDSGWFHFGRLLQRRAS